MKVITLRSQIRDVAERWYKQYPHEDQTGLKLRALDKETATPEDVARIVGNSSWVEAKDCDECEQPSEVVVQLGELPDYESSTVLICPSCLEAALREVNRTFVKRILRGKRR